MKKIIVLGSLNMDLSICCDVMPMAGETINGHDFFINPGGKGGNQAVAAAKLGAETYMIANVGEDMFGKQLLNTLKEYGVHCEHVSVCENVSSGVAVIVCCDNDNRIMLGNGANYTIQIEQIKKAIDELASVGDIFLTQLENKYEVVQEALAYAREKGLYTILNPAPARYLDIDVYEHSDLLVINQSECEQLCGIYPTTEEECCLALEQFSKKDVKALITLGKEGSVFSEEGQLIKILSRKVESVDSTAAGDSYIGGLCLQLAKGKALKDALRFASDVAALCVTRRGAQVAIPYYQEVIDKYKEEY